MGFPYYTEWHIFCEIQIGKELFAIPALTRETAALKEIEKILRGWFRPPPKRPKRNIIRIVYARDTSVLAIKNHISQYSIFVHILKF